MKDKKLQVNYYFQGLIFQEIQNLKLKRSIKIFRS